MRIVLSKDNVAVVIRALDLYSRIFIGQYDHLNWDIRLNADTKKASWNEIEGAEIMRTFLFKEIRDIIIPDLAHFELYASHGIWNFNRNDPRAIDAYDLQQTIRFTDAWFRRPEGGISVCFSKPWIRGRYPEVSVEITGTRNDYQMTIELLQEQFVILKEAAEVFLHAQCQEFEKMFAMFTNDQKALELARKAEQYNVVQRSNPEESAAALVKTLAEQEGGNKSITPPK